MNSTFSCHFELDTVGPTIARGIRSLTNRCCFKSCNEMKCISNSHSFQDGQGSKVSGRDQNLDSPLLGGLQSQSTKQSLSFSVCPPDGAHPSLSIPPFSKLPTPTWWWRPGQWHCLACPRSYLPHVLISSCFLVFMSSWLPVIMSSYPQYSYHLCPHVLMSSYPPCPGQWHSHGPTHPRFCLLTTELPFCRCIKYEPIKPDQTRQKSWPSWTLSVTFLISHSKSQKPFNDQIQGHNLW